MSGARRYDPALAARSVARKLAVQALYRWQLNDSPWQDLVQEFATDPDMAKADREYFRSLIQAAGEQRAVLDEQLAPWLDRAPAALDPVEHAVLWVSLIELRDRPDIPFRVVISEGVALARRFGSVEGHKFVNAILDRAAQALRGAELPAAAPGDG
jgi:N utilization substance protein B